MIEGNVEYVLDTYFLNDGDIWMYGQPNHKIAKCRIDRCIEDFVNIKNVNGGNMKHTKVKFILMYERDTDLFCILDDDNNPIAISRQLHKVYYMKVAEHVCKHKSGYMASIALVNGNRRRKSFKTSEQAHTWFNEVVREEYYEVFSRLNLLSYFN